MIFFQSKSEDTTVRIMEKKTDNPLVSGVINILNRVEEFKELAKTFYFDVILSVHLCPRCDGRIEMSGKSECSCVCGNIFDPTIAFQKSACCGKHLVRKSQHYVCPGCQKTVPSMFLFDEKLFDKAYFREMVRKSRSRAAKRREEMKRFLAESRSGALIFTEEPQLESIPGLMEALDDFVAVRESGTDDFHQDLNPRFKMENYRKYILDILGTDCLMFSDISSLMDDVRQDKIWRFISLIFMQNDREVILTQYGNDLLVERISYETYQ